MNKAWYDSHQTVAGECTDVHWSGQTLRCEPVMALSRVNPLPQDRHTFKVGSSLWERVHPRRGRPG